MDVKIFGWGLYLCVHVAVCRDLCVNLTVWWPSDVQHNISWWFGWSTPMLRYHWIHRERAFRRLSAIVLRTRIPFTKRWLISLSKLDCCQSPVQLLFAEALAHGKLSTAGDNDNKEATQYLALRFSISPPLWMGWNIGVAWYKWTSSYGGSWLSTAWSIRSRQSTARGTVHCMARWLGNEKMWFGQSSTTRIVNCWKNEFFLDKQYGYTGFCLTFL